METRTNKAPPRSCRIIVQYFFLATGTVLSRKAAGDYYVEMTAGEWQDSGIRCLAPGLTVAGEQVEAIKE